MASRNPWTFEDFVKKCQDEDRQLAAERDANRTHPDGDGAGTSSRGVLSGLALPLALIALATAALIALATAALLVAPLLWHAPRCTGPTPADRCPLAGGFKGVP